MHLTCVAPVQGKLRIGLGAETVLVSLAHAVLLHKQGGSIGASDLANKLEEAAQAVKLAYSQCPSYDKLVPALLEHPVEVSYLPRLILNARRTPKSDSIPHFLRFPPYPLPTCVPQHSM